jgi:hypothetical protein
MREARRVGQNCYGFKDSADAEARREIWLLEERSLQQEQRIARLTSKGNPLTALRIALKRARDLRGDAVGVPCGTDGIGRHDRAAESRGLR